MSSRPNPGGLPTNPRARSRSRPRQEESSREGSSSRSLRSQKSTSSFPREPTRSRVGESRRAPRHATRPSEGEHRRSDDSTSSASSGASSLFDRMKSSAASYASSFTTVDDYEEDDKPQPSSLRNRRLARSERSSFEDAPINTDASGTGDGYTVWSRVASAASTLTVSVSKAWTTNVATFAGEETPPGQESRLTRAMKAYHLEKARDPTDLPAWLFAEHERQPLQRAQRSRRDVEEPEQIAPVAQRPRGLRDVYDSVSRSDQTPAPSGPPMATGKGTDRLKALREAKRNAPTMDQHIPPSRTESQESRQRVGLPSGPARRR